MLPAKSNVSFFSEMVLDESFHFMYTDYVMMKIRRPGSHTLVPAMKGVIHMKFIYPAVFQKNQNNEYEGFFPDLECCRVSGETLDEALENASAAAYDWISLELSEEEPILPPVSDVHDLEESIGGIVRNIAVNIRLMDGWDE